MTSIPVTFWAALSTVLCARSTSTRVAAPCFQSTPLPKRRICRSPSLGAGCGRLIRRFHVKRPGFRMSRHSVLPVRYQHRSFWRNIEAGPSDANPYPVPRAACLDDCAANVFHQGNHARTPHPVSRETADPPDTRDGALLRRGALMVISARRPAEEHPENNGGSTRHEWSHRFT